MDNNGVSLGVAEEYTFSMKGNVISIKDGNTNAETFTYDRTRDIIFYDMQASYELLAGFGNILAGATGEKRKKISSQEVEMFFQQLGVQPPVWGKNGTSYTPPKTTPIITISLENNENDYIKVGGNVSNATTVSIDILDKTTGQKTSAQSVNRTGNYWNYVLKPVSQGHTYKFAVKEEKEGGDVWAEKEVTVEYQFDRNAYVYIVNESQAVPIGAKTGHNFIMFEDKNAFNSDFCGNTVLYLAANAEFYHKFFNRIDNFHYLSALEIDSATN